MAETRSTWRERVSLFVCRSTKTM
uniref:Uncharacterized protein n=1 Tax=Anguilla anguilla TaxID=7936 RepID=A0A0E9UA60_ANGAN